MNITSLIKHCHQHGATNLTSDSRQVRPNAFFVTLAKNKSIAQKHAQQAIKNGAIGILYDETLENIDCTSIPCFTVRHLQQRWPQILNTFYHHPSQQVTLIGVTGTNGKTSICHFLAQALTALNKKIAVLGTMGNGIWPNLKVSPLTTLPLDQIQYHLAEFVAQQVDIVLLEVSSHGIAQGRIAGLNFDIGVYSNLSQDHLDYHRTMQQYAATKAQFFSLPTQAVVINQDDNYAEIMTKQKPTETRYIGYSRNQQQANIRLCDATFNATHMDLTLSIFEEKITCSPPLIGTFMIDNLLAVIGVLYSLGIKTKEITSALAALSPPMGRLERIHLPNQTNVVIDFAHSPDSMEKVLTLLRGLCHGKLWVVFGCGGDRDRSKRPIMTHHALKYADHVIVTEDNPRREDPQQIVSDMLADCQDNPKIMIILSREKAIRHALSQATPQDWVALLGKGHETYQIVGDEKRTFDERHIVRQWHEE